MNKFLIILLFIPIIAFSSTWGCINRTGFECNTWRMSVPHGWLIASDNSAGGGEHGYAMVFVADEKHEWKE